MHNGWLSLNCSHHKQFFSPKCSTCRLTAGLRLDPLGTSRDRLEIKGEEKGRGEKNEKRKEERKEKKEKGMRTHNSFQKSAH